MQPSIIFTHELYIQHNFNYWANLANTTILYSKGEQNVYLNCTNSECISRNTIHTFYKHNKKAAQRKGRGKDIKMGEETSYFWSRHRRDLKHDKFHRAESISCFKWNFSSVFIFYTYPMLRNLTPLRFFISLLQKKSTKSRIKDEKKSLETKIVNCLPFWINAYFE